MKSTLLFLSFVLVGTLSFAQIDIQPVQKNNHGSSKSHHVELPTQQLRDIMLPAGPNRFDSQGQIDLPLPNGQSHTFLFEAAHVLHDKMRSKYPNIGSYSVVSLDGQISGRIAISPLGISGLLFSGEGDIYYEPIEGDLHKVYIADYANGGKHSCEADHESMAREAQTTDTRSMMNGLERTYTIAIAATGEWSNKYNNNLTTINSKINEYLTELNAIYERDIAITFTLTGENDDIIFFDGATDGLDPNNRLSSAQSVISANISSANYDIGHVFYEMPFSGNGYTGSGLASLGVVCNNSAKARGWSGCGGNYPTSFWMGIFAHELGHQFNAAHTFYGTAGFCGLQGQRSVGSGVEPGSGNSLMSYEGSCGAGGSCDNQNISPQSPFIYLHGFTIEQIQAFVNSSGSCYASQNINNSAPIVTVPANTTIPKETPFTLTATASDPDGDLLLVGWEEVDTDNLSLSCPQGHPDDAATSTTAPLFRSFAPAVGAESRTFPQLDDILDDSQTLGEILPAVERDINMRFSARAAALGGVSYEDMVVSVAGNSGPFEVLTANTPTGYQASEQVNVQWAVNNTNAAPVSCSHVNILFSLDGGTTFPLTLASNTPNDGSQTITMPATGTQTGRIKIEAVGNIFFDINNADIAISSSCNPVSTTISNDEDVTADAGDPALDLDLIIGDVVTTFSGSLESGDPTMNLTAENTSNGNCVSFTSPIPRYETIVLQVQDTDTYTFSSSAPFFSIVNLYQTSFSSGSPCTNWLASSGLYDPSAGTITTSAFSYTLTAGDQIELLLSGFWPDDSGSFSVNITGAAGGQMLQSTNFPPGFNYKYVTTDDAGTIKAIQDDADLSDDNIFTGGVYTVRGLLLFGNSTLSTYVDGPFSALSADVTAGTICGQFSTNDVTVTVNGCIPGTRMVTSASSQNVPGSLPNILSDSCPEDVIVFSTALSGQTITFSSEMMIDSDLVLTGLGKTELTLSGGGTTRIFGVAPGVQFTVNDITLADGFAPTEGGAINNLGIMRLSEVRFVNNKSGTENQAFSNSGEVVILAGETDIKE